MLADTPLPSSITGEWLRGHWQELGLEQEVVGLVCALLDTGVLWTTYSCRGHFNLREHSAFCHHNQKAQVHFQVKLIFDTAIPHLSRP
jgi:hypothetical protein